MRRAVPNRRIGDGAGPGQAGLLAILPSPTPTTVAEAQEIVGLGIKAVIKVPVQGP